MAADVLYGNSNTYFNMKRFEDSIDNMGIVRQKIIEKRRSMLIFDKILMIFFLISFLIVIVIFGRIIYESLKIKEKSRQITKLEAMLNEKRFDRETIIEELKSGIKYDNLKAKAYLELNMITPTEKNIIYFEKDEEKFER